MDISFRELKFFCCQFSVVSPQPIIVIVLNTILSTNTLLFAERITFSISDIPSKAVTKDKI